MYHLLSVLVEYTLKNNAMLYHVEIWTLLESFLCTKSFFIVDFFYFIFIFLMLKKGILRNVHWNWKVKPPGAFDFIIF